MYHLFFHPTTDSFLLSFRCKKNYIDRLSKVSSIGLENIWMSKLLSYNIHDIDSPIDKVSTCIWYIFVTHHCNILKYIDGNQNDRQTLCISNMYSKRKTLKNDDSLRCCCNVIKNSDDILDRMIRYFTAAVFPFYYLWSQRRTERIAIPLSTV